FEDPTAGTSFLSCLAILLLPAASLVQFGKMLRAPRHAAVLAGVMVVLFVAMIGWAIYWDTAQPNPALAARPELSLEWDHAAGTHFEKTAPALAGLLVEQDLGNLEGKELRFGTSAGATFAAVTTAVACGSVNCTHDSLNPLAGLTPFVGMWLNSVLGGKGAG